MGTLGALRISGDLSSYIKVTGTIGSVTIGGPSSVARMPAA